MKRTMDRISRLERQLDPPKPERVAIFLCDEDRERYAAEYRQEHGRDPILEQSGTKIDLGGGGER